MSAWVRFERLNCAGVACRVGGLWGAFDLFCGFLSMRESRRDYSVLASMLPLVPRIGAGKTERLPNPRAVRLRAGESVLFDSSDEAAGG